MAYKPKKAVCYDNGHNYAVGSELKQSIMDPSDATSYFTTRGKSFSR